MALVMCIVVLARMDSLANKEEVDKLFNVAGKLDAKLIQSVANVAKLIELHSQATGHEFIDGHFTKKS